jgi:hypothetical protein
MKNRVILLPILLLTFCVHAQFAPQAGVAGTTAIHKDSSVFKAWATQCELKRGWQNSADTTLGKAVVGDETYVPGPAGNGVVSLGDGGIATVAFEHPIINGEGPDFAIFENGFIDQTLAPGTAFLELAFVEVSSDGVNFFRFPSTCLNDTTQQLQSFEGMFATNVNNLAGKYIGSYGTPFDVQELDSIAELNINAITHVRIVDVVGSLNPSYASRDAQGNRINDPWPTPFASGGFDLDAIGVIHHDITQSVHSIYAQQSFQLYPNPAAIHQSIFINTTSTETPVWVYDLMGHLVSNYTLSTTSNGMELRFNQPGMYQVMVQSKNGSVSKRVVVEGEGD